MLFSPIPDRFCFYLTAIAESRPANVQIKTGKEVSQNANWLSSDASIIQRSPLQELVSRREGLRNCVFNLTGTPDSAYRSRCLAAWRT